MFNIMKKIYTLGTGLRSREDFIEILDRYSIRRVIDVRSFPSSKLDHFKKANLEPLLHKELIGYRHLGKELGGLRKEGYEQYTRSKAFLDGVTVLESIALEETSVIICAEHLPWKCHRRFISRELQKRGWTVEHIIDIGKTWTPE